MSDPIYVITGATGHVGSGICSLLLAKGRRVRAIARNAERLRELADRGADVHAGSLEDAAFVAGVLRGATAVFAMIPPNPAAGDFRAYAGAIIDAYARAIPASGVNYVVDLSSLGAHLKQGAGVIDVLHQLEERLDAIPGLDVLHLRPTYFLENHLNAMPLIDEHGIIGGALDAGLRLPMIATRDIAAVAARRLQDLDFVGASVLELHGADEFSMDDAARVIGRAIGKPELRYVRFSYDDARAAMVGMGLSESFTDELLVMYRAFNEGMITPTQPRSAATTTSTTLEDFAQVFAEAYRSRHAPAGR
jgi:uncharacterized protein YbjT (DUF2867 family)